MQTMLLFLNVNQNMMKVHSRFFGWQKGLSAGNDGGAQVPGRRNRLLVNHNDNSKSRLLKSNGMSLEMLIILPKSSFLMHWQEGCRKFVNLFVKKTGSYSSIRFFVPYLLN